MKTIIFLFTMVLAIALISGRKQSAQNALAEKHANPVTLEDFKGANKLDMPKSKEDAELSTTNKAHVGSARILFILHNDKGQGAWSPSLWWSYQHDGC